MSDVFDTVADAVAHIGASADSGTLETVVGIWQRVLQRGPVRPDDDFFDLGGDSLLALQLFAELERVTGRKLPITTIYDASTPADLATLLDATAAPRPVFSPLVLLNDVPGGPPIFLIHGIGGNVMELAQLGRSIQADRRVFAVQARGLDGMQPPIETIHEMADYYLSEIRREQPLGPYLLIGYSFGGMVALEMARRIEAAGQTVGFMGFIDSYPHPNQWPLLSWLDVRWRRAVQGANRRLRTLLAALDGRLRPGRAGLGLGASRPFMFDDGWPEAVKRVYDTSVAALARYTPAGYAGSVVFFRAAKRSYYLPDNPKGMWGRLIQNFDIVTVPGDHLEMVDRNAASLGAEIARRLPVGPAGV